MTTKTMYVKHIKTSECMQRLIIKVKFTGLKIYKIRLFFCTQLIKFAAFIAGTKLRMEIELKNDEK